MAKSSSKTANSKPVAENGNAQAPAPKKKDDGFKEVEGGNKIFEEWRGEIKIETNKKKEVIKKYFNPLVKQHGRRKITQAEADALNLNAANSPRMDFVIMYLEPGQTQPGEQQDVNEIVPDAMEGTE